jgi:Domain of unknown function (DUF4167)
MRNGQNKRMRGRNRKGHHHNPLTRVYESNGPDVKIRGTANHVAEKYVQLARDAQASGDPVSAENYYQHAEHYFRLIAAAHEQFRQSQPYYRPEGSGEQQRDESYQESDEENRNPLTGGNEPGYAPREPQHFSPREHQPYPPREPQPYGGPQPHYPRPQHPQQQQGQQHEGDVDRLPSFITGAPPQQHQGYGQNGSDNQPDRFPLHRRRRRHRGHHRGDVSGGQSHEARDDGPPRSGND